MKIKIKKASDFKPMLSLGKGFKMATVKHGKRYYKQMALEVAVRTPERYIDILKTFGKFEGRILNDSCILEMYIQLYLDGVIDANDLEDENLNYEFLKLYIVENKSHNNEWGFPTGYQAAFCRYLKTLSEFGFIYSQYNEILKISPVGRALISGKITLSEAFALQSMRFWRKSPYRRVLNDFNFFDFILKVIVKRGEKGKKLSYAQFMVALFSDNGNVEEFISLIEENKIGNDMDAAYELVKRKYDKIDTKHSGVSKQNTAFKDYGNTVFRVLQLTGFITVDYSGVILLSINKNRFELLEKLQKENFEITKTAQEDEKEYFDILGSFPAKLENMIVSYREQEDLSTVGYNKKIPSILSSYKLDRKTLADYLLDTSNGKKDSRVFWFIQAPIKFELLLTLYLYTCYGDKYAYKPNFKCDDAGIPYSHAPGNMGDIEVYNSTVYWLVEATLIRNKTQQINNETVNLFRHISANSYKEKYLSLVAPYIHDDTKLMLSVATIISMVERKEVALYSLPQSTEEFVASGEKNSHTDDIKNYSFSFLANIKDFLNKEISL